VLILFEQEQPLAELISKKIKMTTSEASSMEPRSLNAVQLMLLRIFNRNLSEQQLADIQAMLLNYLNEQLQVQLEKDIAKKNITQADLDLQLNDYQRSNLP
jgi:hypothetical protein